MAPDRVERRLAAILAADMVGYSRLMEADEGDTLARQKAHRRELIDPKIAEYRGRIVKTTGDGLLVEFASVVDATECAVAIQRAMAEREAEVPEERRIRYRVGVNLGDIVIDGDDIFGDGVNVAARLEGLAEPGGICVRRAVRNQVRDKLDLAFEDMGEVKVKNISRPIRVFRILLDGKPTASPRPAGRIPWSKRGIAAAVAAALLIVVAGGVTVWRPWAPDVEPASVERMAFPLPDKPSIAVLPFTNMSGDPEQEYFVDGMTEDITTALSRFKHLFVIARNSAFAYKGKQANAQQVGRELGVRFILKGTVQRSDNRLRITARLSDSTTGSQLWAERYDRGLSDVFVVQDEVKRRIVATITTMEGTLTKAVLAHAGHKPTSNVQVYDLHLRAVHEWLKFTRDANTESRRLNRRALELDPQFARGYSGLAWDHVQEVQMGWSDNPAKSLASARDLASKSIILDDRDHYTRWALGAAYLYGRQYDEAFAELERARALNPNDADLIAFFARVLTFSGRAEEGIETMATAMRLNPHYPWWYSFFMGVAQFTARNYKDAVASFQDNPGPSPPHNYLAAAHAHLGQMEAARAAAARMLKDRPDFTVGLAAKITPYQHQADLNHLLDGLRKAGLPE